jgi:hypothetical protein
MRVERTKGGSRPAGRAGGACEPLDEAGRTALERLAQMVPSERQAAALLQVGERTYVRAMAGLGLRRGTRLLIETRLRELLLAGVTP